MNVDTEQKLLELALSMLSSNIRELAVDVDEGADMLLDRDHDTRVAGHRQATAAASRLRALADSLSRLALPANTRGDP